jgi:hypothetical protein
MSLAPPWAKAAAVLGLEMQILQLRLTASLLKDAPTQFLEATIHDFEVELERIEAMKN